MSRRLSRRAIPANPAASSGPPIPVNPPLTGLVLRLESPAANVTLSGGFVATWIDRSPSGANVTQGTAAQQPGWSAADAFLGAPILTFDGVNDNLTNAATNLVTTGSNRTVLFACAPTAGGNGGAVITFRLTATQLYLLYGIIGGTSYVAGDGTTNFVITAILTGAPIVMAWEIQYGTKPIVIGNGTVMPTTAGTLAAVESGTTGFQVGEFVGGGSFFAGFAYALLVYDHLLSAADLALALVYLARNYGVVGVQGAISDSQGYGNTTTSDFRMRASFAATRLQTRAASMTLTAVNTATALFAFQLTVLVDGTFNVTIPVAADSALHSTVLTVDGASHVVEIWDGCQASVGTSGTALVAVSEPSGLTSVLPAAIPGKRLVVYGDSIISGWQADEARHGCFQLIRQDSSIWAGRISFAASVGRLLHDDFAIDPTFVTLANELLSLANEVSVGGKRVIALCIGYNDFNTPAWANIAAFQAAYLVLLQAIRAADATVTIVVQTPIVASNEAVPNAALYTLIDVRNSETTAAGAVAGVSVFQGNVANGAAPAVSLAQLADGVHPNTAGHFTYHTWWAQILATV